MMKKLSIIRARSTQNSRVVLLVMVTSLIVIVSVGIPSIPVNAQWVQPTCNPDGPGGPADPSCNVSAPLNVSSADQTKQGGLTVQSTIRAADLYVSDSIAGTGSVSVITGSQRAITVNQTNSTLEGVGVKVSGTAAGLHVSQAAKGAGIQVTQSGQTGTAMFVELQAKQNIGIDIDANIETRGLSIHNLGDDSIGAVVRSSGAHVIGLDVDVSGTGLVVNSAGSASEPAVKVGASGSGAGIEVQAKGGPGIKASAEAPGVYAAQFCWQGTDCAYLGGFPYNAFIPGDLYIKSSADPFIPLLQVLHENQSSTPGLAAQFYQYGAGTPLSPRVAPQGTAIDAQAVDGPAIYGYSQKGDAAYFESSENDTSAVKVKHTGIPLAATQQNYGVDILLSGSYGAGIRSRAPQGTAGGFISGEAHTALIASSAPNSAGTIGGIGITADGGAGGTGIIATASFHGNIGAGTGVRVFADGGSNGIVVEGRNDAATNVGIRLDLSDYDIGVDVNNTSPFDSSIEATGLVNTTSALGASTFYTTDRSNNGVNNTLTPDIVDEIRLGSVEITDMVFDGSDFWISEKGKRIYRVNAATGRIISDFEVGMVQNHLAFGNGLIYVLGKDTVLTATLGYEVLWAEIDPLGDGVVNSGGTGEYYQPSALEYDGDRLWIGATNSDGIYTYETSSGIGEPVHTLPAGMGTVYDIVFVNGLVYATAEALDMVLEIDPAGPNVQRQIDVGVGPRGLLYDGRFLWTANYTGNSISRVDIPTQERRDFMGKYRAYYLATDGSRLWYSSHTALNDQLRALNIVEGVDDVDSRVETGSRPQQVLFDGTYLWVIRSDVGSGSYSLIKVAVGEGYGHGGVPVHNGLLMYGETGDEYCIYVDVGGVLQTDVSLVNCQN